MTLLKTNQRNVLDLCVNNYDCYAVILKFLQHAIVMIISLLMQL